MTTAYAIDDLLGLGIYTVAEAATYARVSVAKLSRWVLGTSKSRPAIKARLDPQRNPERWITFPDFVQSMAIRDIRIAHPNIHMDKIHDTIVMARKKFGIEFPFARRHVTKLCGEHLSLNIEGYGIIEATGPHKEQLNFRVVMEKYLEDLSYDAEGLAKGYSPITYNNYMIVLNPHVRFGEPMITPSPGSGAKKCRYSVRALCDAFEAEGTYELAGEALGVAPEAVQAATKYLFDYLRPIDVA